MRLGRELYGVDILESTMSPITALTMVRKTTKTKGAFVSEKAVVKQIYLAILNAQTKWKGTIFGWAAIRQELDAYYGERFYQNDTVNWHSRSF